MIFITQLIYLRPGREKEFLRFEEDVLPLLAEYGGELLLRLRPNAESIIAGPSPAPYEVHLLQFESEDGIQRYSADPRRQRILHLKDDSIERVVLVKGAL